MAGVPGFSVSGFLHGVDSRLHEQQLREYQDEKDRRHQIASNMEMVLQNTPYASVKQKIVDELGKLAATPTSKPYKQKTGIFDPEETRHPSQGDNPPPTHEDVRGAVTDAVQNHVLPALLNHALSGGGSGDVASGGGGQADASAPPNSPPAPPISADASSGDMQPSPLVSNIDLGAPPATPTAPIATAPISAAGGTPPTGALPTPDRSLPAPSPLLASAPPTTPLPPSTPQPGAPPTAPATPPTMPPHLGGAFESPEETAARHMHAARAEAELKQEMDARSLSTKLALERQYGMGSNGKLLIDPAKMAGLGKQYDPGAPDADPFGYRNMRFEELPPKLQEQHNLNAARVQIAQNKNDIARLKAEAYAHGTPDAWARVGIAQQNANTYARKVMNDEIVSLKKYPDNLLNGDGHLLSGPAQKSMAELDPRLKRINQLIDSFEPYKNINQPYYLLAERMKYDIGFGSSDDIGKEISALELAKLQSVASVTKGMSRNIRVFEEGLIHAAKTKTDSPMLIHQKLVNIRDQLVQAERGAVQFGNKTGAVSGHMTPTGWEEGTPPSSNTNQLPPSSGGPPQTPISSRTTRPGSQSQGRSGGGGGGGKEVVYVRGANGKLVAQTQP